MNKIETNDSLYLRGTVSLNVERVATIDVPQIQINSLPVHRLKSRMKLSTCASKSHSVNLYIAADDLEALKWKDHVFAAAISNR